MGFYGNIVLESATPAPLSETAQIIESSFAFLNEASSITVIKKEIDELKKKDEITDKDIKALAEKVKKISDTEEKSKAICWIVELVLSYCLAMVGIAGKLTASIASILVSSTLLVQMNKDYGTNGATVYAKIIKLEAKINNQIKKIQSLETENDDSKAELKDLNKSLEILTRLKPAFKNKLVNRESAIEEAVLLEFKGNQDKTEAFKIICEEMAGLCEFNYKKIQTVKTAINEMISALEKGIKASTDKATGDMVVKVRETGRQCQKDIDKLAKEYGVNYPVTLTVFRKDVKSFTVKYSEVTMEEKKRIADKLQAMDKKIYEIGKEYSTSNEKFHDKMLALYDDIAKAGKSSTLNTPYDTLMSWLNYIVSECNLTSQDIKGIMTDLNIKKTENSFIYKVLNPVKKK